MNKNSLNLENGTAGQTEKMQKQKKVDLEKSELSQPIKSTQGDFFYKDIIETIREPVLVLDSDLRVLHTNQSFNNTFKVTAQETVGNLIYDLGSRQWDIPKLHTLLDEILPRTKMFNDYQVDHVFPAIGKRTMLLNARQIINSPEKQQLILLAIEDITDRIIFEQTLQTTKEHFRRVFETTKEGILLIDNTELLNSLQVSNAELVNEYEATLKGWMEALDVRNNETEGHTQRVTELSLKLASRMGIKDTEIVHFQRGALLHDIGKVAVSNTILNKPGPLTREEWSIIRKHPLFAFQLLSKSKFLIPALDIPYCHHEKWDGSGYPRGLKGEAIPLAARIFAIVDVWDALISDRPYRKAWTKSEAMAFMQEQSGKHFYPEVVSAFQVMIQKSRK